jgi:hypothetical protein
MSAFPYTAEPKDDSLESYMVEALYLLELQFERMDEDGAGYLLYLLHSKFLIFFIFAF